MRTKIVLGLVAILAGCASLNTPVKKKSAPSLEKRVTTPVKKTVKFPKSRPQSQAVWHLISPSEIEFVLRHLKSGKREYVRVETTLSSLELPTGQYSIESLVFGEEKYDALEGQEMFQFEIKRNSPTYVGSYVVECPKVGSAHFSELKKMKFFNRLNFTGDSGPCEVIVGNDLPNVRRAWSKLEKKPPFKLQLGF